MAGGGGRRREEGGGTRDTESKTRTPHKIVGNKLSPCCSVLAKPDSCFESDLCFWVLL